MPRPSRPFWRAGKIMSDDQHFASKLENRLRNLARHSVEVGSPADSICTELSELVADPSPFDVKLLHCVEALFGTCAYGLHVCGPSWSLEVGNGTTGEALDGVAYLQFRKVPVVIPGTDRPIGTLSIAADQGGTANRNLKQRLELLAQLVGYILLSQFPELTVLPKPSGPGTPSRFQRRVPKQPSSAHSAAMPSAQAERGGLAGVLSKRYGGTGGRSTCVVSGEKCTHSGVKTGPTELPCLLLKLRPRIATRMDHQTDLAAA